MGLKIHQLKLGSYDNLICVLADEATKEAVIIDPAWDVPALLKVIEDNGYDLVGIWLTHAHGDHIEGVPAVLDYDPDVPVWASPDTLDSFIPPYPVFDIEDEMELGDLTFEVFHTPGHSPGGVCFKYGDDMIVGDTLFVDGCGRCDLPQSDVNAMYDSIHGVLMSLPDSTIIYPGHDYGPTPTDTIGNQKKTNRFMLAATREAFVKERMG
ncbi:MAG: MBL fold metallo-hydrolase [Chloroflexota bacterium]